MKKKKRTFTYKLFLIQSVFKALPKFSSRRTIQGVYHFLKLVDPVNGKSLGKFISTFITCSWVQCTQTFSKNRGNSLPGMWKNILKCQLFLGNAEVVQTRQLSGFPLTHTCAYFMHKKWKGRTLLWAEESQERTRTGYYPYIFPTFGLM